ncbi:nucleotidyltransferase [Acidicapsa ligni]|uniref:nucleotidyltransferase n=1 Tax=Acidicapsa ligni TaxID=542300 RepID=UPI0021E0B12F|nr:nucleotidyltransferase [Acidicapsa ligni]
MLPEDLKQLLLAFNANEVEYLVVGGYAVGIHAEPRATKDLDLFIRSADKNSKAVYCALVAYGAPLVGLTPADFRDDPDSVFQIGQPPARVDILQHISGVEFEEAWKQRTEAIVDGVPAHIISIEHLIQNKLESGRMQDLADVEAIREAQINAKTKSKD